jgi:hypothetical protein
MAFTDKAAKEELKCKSHTLILGKFYEAKSVQSIDC